MSFLSNCLNAKLPDVKVNKHKYPVSVPTTKLVPRGYIKHMADMGIASSAD